MCTATPAPGNIIAFAFTPRNLGAALGICASIVTVAWIVHQLSAASEPQMTPVVLVSNAPGSLEVERLVVDGQVALARRWAAHPAAAEAEVGMVQLRVGRPVEVLATLAAPQTTSPRCNPEPRPYGKCRLRLQFESATELRCEFLCKAEEPKP